MISLILRLCISALALLVAAYVVPGIVVSSIYIALVTAVVLGLLNAIVRPILLVLTFPITIVTLGLFTFVINAGLFWFASTFIEGFVVDGFLPALIGSIVVSVVSAIGNKTIT